MSQRPVLSVPRSSQIVILDLIAIAGLVALWAAAVYGWTQVPLRLPIHFGLDGHPDVWSNNRNWLWLLPCLGTVHLITFTIVRHFPHTFNYPVAITAENAAYQYTIAVKLITWLQAEILLGLAYIQWQMVQAALEQAIGLGVWFIPLFLLVILGTSGYWLRAALTTSFHLQ
ncbi:MAG: DUF1648 domain-containing protein [Cyanobacteria bacterium]|nr:DUF1648 domain-containing protein [Cyanobacteriota bacterium]MDW8200131.1 DUF1648 domain-containing protein [Cyanobacteriota bacterium SKYGB_h_bin112]